MVFFFLNHNHVRFIQVGRRGKGTKNLSKVRVFVSFCVQNRIVGSTNEGKTINGHFNYNEKWDECKI